MRSGQLIYKSRTMTEFLLRCGFPNIQIYLSVCPSSLCLSLCFSLSLSLTHTVYEKSAEMEYGPPEMEYGYLEVFPQNEKSLNL